MIQYIYIYIFQLKCKPMYIYKRYIYIKDMAINGINLPTLNFDLCKMPVSTAHDLVANLPRIPFALGQGVWHLVVGQRGRTLAPQNHDGDGNQPLPVHNK